MTRKLIVFILLLIVMVGLAWNIERTARPVPDHDAAIMSGSDSEH